MQNDLVTQIQENRNYQMLVSKRSRYGWTLTAIMVVVYYGFILLVAFDKEFLSTKLSGGATTWGIPIGLFVIFFTVIITGIYVRRANSEFDGLTAQIREEVNQ